MKKGERTDRLRKRPDTIRYYYMAAGTENIHVGLSHANLQKVMAKDEIHTVFLADVVTKRVRKVDPEKFLPWWRQHYQDPQAEYVEEV